MNTALTLFCLLGLLMGASSSALAQDVRYPRPETQFDQRTDYPFELLRMALAVSAPDVQLVPTDDVMLQGRALHELARNRHVDVVWSMTSLERERMLRPIRIPIYKGLIGWRLMLIRDNEQAAFDDIQGIKGLRDKLLVQGHDWPDTRILQENGFKVLGVPNYESTFQMLIKGRVDAFPRSVIEIWAEAENFADRGLTIERNLVIRYPTAFYYFVSRSRPDLARKIRKGLESLADSGTFDTLFQSRFGQLLAQARLRERRFIDLYNPLLPPQTPLDQKKLWYRMPFTDWQR